VITRRALLFSICVAWTVGCAAGGSEAGAGAGAGSGIGAGATGLGGAGGVGQGGGFDPCEQSCSVDGRSVVDCNGVVTKACSEKDACDAETLECVDACTLAAGEKRSVGCEYYATFMDLYEDEVCFAAVVANSWGTPAQLRAFYGEDELPLEYFARIPVGAGPDLTYGSFLPEQGLPAGEVAILFLSGPHPGNGGVECPVPSAIEAGVVLGRQTGIGRSFRITSDVPVVAYQFNPFGGGSAATTGSSLLLPTSVWDQNYVLANTAKFNGLNPSLNIVAMEDDTNLSLLPRVAVLDGPGIPFGPPGLPMLITLQKGEHAQISQSEELTGSILYSDRPVGVMAGHQCMNLPAPTDCCCDHGEQMVPPIRALGSEYVAVAHRPRSPSDVNHWKVVAAVDGTELSYETESGAVLGPAGLDGGGSARFSASEPFIVRSQDDDHPFMLFTEMTGSDWLPLQATGRGDPEVVLSVPPGQYSRSYVFFADPTYPETNLVVVRTKQQGEFHDVVLDCAGPLTGWTALGEYEWTRVDLSTGDFQPVGQCSTGRREISSAAPFGLWVWGWGSFDTTEYSAFVSYGYPAGMNVQPINSVVVPAVPR
jgi:hypothetical protein